MKIINILPKGYLLLPPFWKKNKSSQSPVTDFRRKKTHRFFVVSLPFTLKANVFSVPQGSVKVKFENIWYSWIVLVGFLRWILESFFLGRFRWSLATRIFVCGTPKSELQQCHTIDRSPWIRQTWKKHLESLWSWIYSWREPRDCHENRHRMVLFAVWFRDFNTREWAKDGMKHSPKSCESQWNRSCHFSPSRLISCRF